MMQGIKFGAEHESNIKILLDNIPCTMTIWDEQLNVLHVSKNAVEMFGLLDTQECYTGLLERLSPEFQPCGTPSRTKGLQIVSEAFREGQASCEWTHLTAAGEPFTIALKLLRLTFEKKPYVLGYATDLRPFMVMHDRELERAAMNRLQAILDASPLGCCIMDNYGTILDCNKATLALFNLKDKEEYKQRFHELSPELQPCGTPSKIKVHECIEQATADGKVTFEWMHQSLDGESIPVEITLITEIIDDKTLVIGFLRDLRNYYQYELAEREAQARQKLMIDSIPILINYWDADYNIKGANKYSIDFYGYNSFEEGVERVHDELIMGTEWYDRLDEIFAKGSASFTYQDLLGYYWEVEGVRTTYNNEPVVVTYGKNITYVKELQEAQRQIEISEESNKAKTMFIANISHEIRTPMNSILGYSELALEKELSPEIRDYLRQIVKSSNWLLSIINNVLDISKIESGLLEIEKTPVDIVKLIETCQYLVVKDAEDKDIKLSFSVKISDMQGKWILGDPTKLSQICTNILSNAIKFTNRGGAVTVTMVAEKLTANKAVLYFEFKDTGIGISKDQLVRIFEPFMQADSSTTRKYGGTGLGLFITKRLVEAMGGKLMVQSKPGEGSVFSFSMKVDLVDALTRSDINNNRSLFGKPVFEKGEVLVVDDNSVNLSVVCEHLKHVGLTPSTAENGKEAVEKVKQRIKRRKPPYDLILMDIHMPEMDGREASSNISKLNVGTPIVAMTAETPMFLDDSKLSDFGISGYLGKPFTTQEIWRCLLKHFEPVHREINSEQYISADSKSVENEELLKELRDLFARTNKDTMEKFTSYLQQEDLKTAHILMHALKSSSLVIGKPELSGIAKRLEDVLKNKKCPSKKLINELETEMRKVLDDLEHQL